MPAKCSAAKPSAMAAHQILLAEGGASARTSIQAPMGSTSRSASTIQRHPGSDRAVRGEAETRNAAKYLPVHTCNQWATEGKTPCSPAMTAVR